jgi:hypothetical protein
VSCYRAEARAEEEGDEDGFVHLAWILGEGVSWAGPLVGLANWTELGSFGLCWPGFW